MQRSWSGDSPTELLGLLWPSGKLSALGRQLTSGSPVASESSSEMVSSISDTICMKPNKHQILHLLL